MNNILIKFCFTILFTCLFVPQVYANDFYPTVIIRGTSEGEEYCLGTWNESGQRRTWNKCFISKNDVADSKLRAKINTLIRINKISDEKFIELIKNAQSLQDSYYILGKEYPINRACQKIELRHQLELKDYQKDLNELNCNTEPQMIHTSGPAKR